MATLEQRFKAFVKLGEFFINFTKTSSDNLSFVDDSDEWYSNFESAITLAGHKNGWFTRQQADVRHKCMGGTA